MEKRKINSKSREEQKEKNAIPARSSKKTPRGEGVEEKEKNAHHGGSELGNRGLPGRNESPVNSEKRSGLEWRKTIWKDFKEGTIKQTWGRKYSTSKKKAIPDGGLT